MGMPNNTKKNQLTRMERAALIRCYGDSEQLNKKMGVKGRYRAIAAEHSN